MYISSRAACVYPLQVVVLWGTLLNTLHGIQQCRSFISTRQVQKQEKVAVMQLVLPYFSKYCSVRLKMLSLVFAIFMYYLCEKYYKPIIVQFYNM